MSVRTDIQEVESNIPGDESEKKQYGISTIAVHAGSRPDPVTGAHETPIYNTTAYQFEDAEHASELFNLQTFGYVYSRMTNPTVSVFEERIAQLEGGRGAVASASGHAAQFLAAVTLLEAGDEFIASRNLYGGSVTQFGVSFPKLGWKCHFVDPTDPNNFEAAMTDKVKFIFCEGVANPGGIILDIERIADIANKHGVLFIVDNTLASPYLMRPFEWGADLVVHSTTKFIGGHGNTMGGILVESGNINWSRNDKYPGMTKPDDAYHGLTFSETFGDFGFTMKTRMVALRDYGALLNPTAAWNMLQGVETLPLRMQRHCDNAQVVAEWLEKHPKVTWVSYPGLKSSPFYELGQKYLPKGKGAVFTFGIKGGFDAGIKLIDCVELHSHLANIGDTKSLILHPASTTHRQLSDEQRIGAGAAPDVVRLSVGIEDVDDIIADLEQAFDQV